MQTAQAFWDDVFTRGQEAAYSRIELPDPQDPVLQRALEHFGDLRGKTVLDLGCGRGATSLHFARCGARVISVDLSQIAVQNLKRYCHSNGLRQIEPVHASALDIAALGPVDAVFGSMILHHIEPFGAFAEALSGALRPGGKAFFWENNARSQVMVWFRRHVVGKLWVPKYGDPDEFPLTPDEVDALRARLPVRIEYPELMCFRLVSAYLLRGRLTAPFDWMDRVGYRWPWLRQYSYRQYVMIG